jgi:hypothetical protein
MKSVFPIVAGVLDGDVNKNIHLEWVIDNDPIEPDEIIICLCQVDRETIPGASIVLDEKDVYLSLEDFKRLCQNGLKIYKDMKNLKAMRQLEHHSDLRDYLLGVDEDFDE